MKRLCANMLRRFRSSLHVLRVVPHSRHCRVIKTRWPLAAALLPVALLGPAAFGATPTPHPARTQRPVRVDVTKVQPKSLLPKHAEHSEFVVEINKLGQVARVASQRGSDNPTFNAQTYGNALQAFIRTPDGHVVVGTYRLTYDFDVKTARVRRDVVLVRQGGVDPDAKGAALDLMDKAHIHPVSPKFAPEPGASLDPRSLPDIQGIGEPSSPPSPR